MYSYPLKLNLKIHIKSFVFQQILIIFFFLLFINSSISTSRTLVHLRGHKLSNLCARSFATHITSSYSIVFLLNSFSISSYFLLISYIRVFFVIVSHVVSVYAKFLKASSISAINIGGHDDPSPSTSLIQKLISRCLIVLVYPPAPYTIPFSLFTRAISYQVWKPKLGSTGYPCGVAGNPRCSYIARANFLSYSSYNNK